MNTPPIICLCGSTRFKRDFEEVNEKFTLEGYIVLAPGVFVNDPARDSRRRVRQEDKSRLDFLHLRKIDISDFVYVVNPGGYVGESTFLEVKYAIRNGKPVRWMVPPIEVKV